METQKILKDTHVLIDMIKDLSIQSKLAGKTVMSHINGNNFMVKFNKNSKIERIRIGDLYAIYDEDGNIIETDIDQYTSETLTVKLAPDFKEDIVYYSRYRINKRHGIKTRIEMKRIEIMSDMKKKTFYYNPETFAIKNGHVTEDEIYYTLENSNGNLLRSMSTTKSSSGISTCERIYEYDVKNQKISELKIQKLADGEIIKGQSLYYYNFDGRIVEKVLLLHDEPVERYTLSVDLCSGTETVICTDFDTNSVLRTKEKRFINYDGQKLLSYEEDRLPNGATEIRNYYYTDGILTECKVLKTVKDIYNITIKEGE
jgi:hypothetical protein